MSNQVLGTIPPSAVAIRLQTVNKYFLPCLQPAINPKVYFSNRSAAYLKLGDAKSKALKDAERCMELAPEWSKSFSRLGAAQHALGRFEGAVQSLKVRGRSW